MATVPLTLETLRTAGLADVDPDVAALLERELERQRGEIELIASDENLAFFVSFPREELPHWHDVVLAVRDLYTSWKSQP